MLLSPGDVAAILNVFEEVAPEVPTAIRSQTKEIIQGLVASGQSWVAEDVDGNVVGYTLAETVNNTLSLVYVGVSKAARDQHVCSSLVSKLKEIGSPIVADVQSNNKCDMVGRFERFGFVKTPALFSGKTKLRWEPQRDPPV